MKKSSVFSAFILSTALLMPAIAIAADAHSTPIEKLISEIADKPDQHHAIASYYQEKIVEAKEDLAMHTKMRNAYQMGHAKNQDAMAGMRKHCDKLISNAESNIKEYEALAAEHEAIAMKKP
ncbi:MAG TPA: hypothetical protein DIW64_13045 [Cellvibrio sp.]|nr:hypothetical protein [Cellvibrio sp.]